MAATATKVKALPRAKPIKRKTKGPRLTLATAKKSIADATAKKGSPLSKSDFQKGRFGLRSPAPYVRLFGSLDTAIATGVGMVDLHKPKVNDKLDQKLNDAIVVVPVSASWTKYDLTVTKGKISSTVSAEDIPNLQRMFVLAGDDVTATLLTFAKEFLTDAPKHVEGATSATASLEAGGTTFSITAR
jgi:hypothetical protein